MLGADGLASTLTGSGRSRDPRVHTRTGLDGSKGHSCPLERNGRVGNELEEVGCQWTNWFLRLPDGSDSTPIPPIGRPVGSGCERHWQTILQTSLERVQGTRALRVRPGLVTHDPWTTVESGRRPLQAFAAALSPLYHPVKVGGTPLTTDGASRARCGLTPVPTGRTLSTNLQTFMSYIEQFEAELARRLESGDEDSRSIVRWVSEKILESYRNGITAGQKGTQVKRQGQSRRRGLYGKNPDA